MTDLADLALDEPVASGVVFRVDTILGVDTPSFDFTSIPNTAVSLKLTGQVRGTKAAQNCTPTLRFNNDSGANKYRWTLNYNTSNGDPEQHLESAGATSIRLGLCPAASATAGAAGSFSLEIPNYAGAFRKQMIGQNAADDSVSGHAARAYVGGIWLDAAVIDRITIFPDANDWLTGSRFTLWGLA